MLYVSQLGLAVAGFVSLCALSTAYGQSARNFIRNPNFTYSPPLQAGSSSPLAPTGYSAELINDDDNCRLNADQLKFEYKPGAFVNGLATELEVQITNTSKQCGAGFILYMPTLTDDALQLKLEDEAYMLAPPGATLKLSATFATQLVKAGNSGIDALKSGSLGFSKPFRARKPDDKERLLISGVELKEQGFGNYSYKTIANEGKTDFGYRPYFSFLRIESDSTIKLTLKSPVLNYTGPVQDKPTIGGLPHQALRAAPGQKIKLSVPVLPPATNNVVGHVSQIVLVDPFGQETVVSARVASFMGTGSLAPVTDGWLFNLPANLQEGRYTVRYRMNGADVIAGEQAQLAAAGKAVDIGSLMLERSGGMYIGQHFHRMPNHPELPRDQKCANNEEPPSGPNVYKSTYQFTRSLNNDLANNMQLWWPSPGAVQDVNLEKYFDPWADFHAGTVAAGDSAKRLLLTFAAVPVWNTACTANCNLSDRWGPWNFYGPNNLKDHLAGVYKVIQRYKGRVFAVECGNEPDSGYLGGESKLADFCRGLYNVTKAVDPSIPVICPQPAHPNNLKHWLQVKTSGEKPGDGQPISQFCDVVGTHGYGFAGTDAKGAPYLSSTGDDVLHEGGDLRDQVAHYRKVLAALGINKPLMVTEIGFADGVFPDDKRTNWASGEVFSKRPAKERAELIYQTLASARELGLSGYALYSFDGCAENPIEGATQSDVPFGFLGITQPGEARDITVKKLAQAVNDLGMADASNFTAKGRAEQRPYVSIQLDKPKLSLAAGTVVNFVVNVSNTTLLPLDNVRVMASTSNPLLKLGAILGATCTTTYGTTCKFSLGKLMPGETRQVWVPAALNPTSVQRSQLSLGMISSLSASLAVSSQATVPVAPANYNPDTFNEPLLGTTQVTTPAKASAVVLTK
jgi:hypothetical protein